MTRPYSWYPLASSDPVPGDPGTVRVAGENYVAISETIATAADNLRRLVDQSQTVSKAVTEVRTKAGLVADDISRAHERYEATGNALITYANQLSQAQAESEAALRAAQSAQNAIDSAELDVRRAAAALDDAEPADQTAKQAALNQARSAVRTADAALARARTDLQAAIDLRDRAAQQATDTIEDATGSDGLNDGWQENLSPVLHAISDIAGIVASIAGIATLFLGWVPILGQILGAVAVVAGIIALVADIVLAFNGEGSWADVAWGAVSLASFGVGAALARSARAVQATARTVAMDRAAVVAARSGNPAIRANPTRLVPQVLRQAAAEPLRARDLIRLSPGQAWQTWLTATRAEAEAVRSASGVERIVALAGHSGLVTDVGALTNASRLAADSTRVADVGLRCVKIEVVQHVVFTYDFLDNTSSLLDSSGSNGLGSSDPLDLGIGVR